MGSSDKKSGRQPIDWADPGYFSGDSRVGNTVRVLVQLIRPPKGHRTLPTRTGGMLIAVTIGVGTAAFNTGQNILYLALSMLLSTLLVSGILSWMNFKGCRWRLETGRHFRVGETSPVYLELENTKKRLPSYSLTFMVAASRSGLSENLSLRERLDPGKSIRLQWDFKPERRGRETLNLVGLVSRYPFGFLKKSISDSFSKDIIVWPARLAYQFGGDKSGRRWLYGQHRRRGEGVDLVHVRGYRSGDPLKKIHWKASARMGNLQVRETEQEHHQAFKLFIDPSPHLWKEEAAFERMCAFAASLAEDLYQRDQLRSGQVAGCEPVSVGAIEDLYSFLDELGSLERKPVEGDQRPAAGTAIQFIPGPAGTVLAKLGEVTVGQA
ncbi:MAG: DUF58 domain-containing protein [Puniceicoccaceae bacterium]